MGCLGLGYSKEREITTTELRGEGLELGRLAPHELAARPRAPENPGYCISLISGPVRPPGQFEISMFASVCLRFTTPKRVFSKKLLSPTLTLPTTTTRCMYAEGAVSKW